MRRLWIVPALLLLCASCDSESETPTDYFDQCVPGEGPDAACYATMRSPESSQVTLALDIAGRFMDEYPPESLAWNWEEGVMMYAFVELYRVTGDTALRDYYQAWIDHHIEEGYEFHISDDCPPAIAAIALYEELGDSQYGQIMEEVLVYLRTVAARTEEGGISHLGHAMPFATLWLDSLFMFGVPMTRWGELTDDAAVLDELEEQYGIFIEALQKPEGWFQHAYNWLLDEQEDGVFWSRGNSWITTAGHEYLRARLLRGETSPQVEAALAAQVEAVLATQDEESGLWWTVPNRPGETYLETSASALFAYGMTRGYRYGLRDERVLPAIRAALSGVRSRIREDDQGRPVVTGTSIGTSVGDFAYYASIEVEDDVPYGVGAAMLLLLETSGLEEHGAW